MINLNNYESWFLQYADGECSPSEKQAVEAFLLLHPELNEEFGMIMEMRLEPLPLSMPGKESLRFGELDLLNEQYRLEPDLSIVFKDKKILYRSERNKVVSLYRALSAAAVLLFGIGLYWMLSGETVQPEVVSIPAIRNTPQVPATVVDQIKKSVADAAETKAKAIAAASVVGSVPDAEQFSTVQQEPVIPADLITRVQEPFPVNESRKTVANLSEEALNAAALRMQASAAEESIALPLNTAAILHDAQKENEKKPLRSIIRTLSRRILHDEETEEREGYIQVASFHIHVKH